MPYQRELRLLQNALKKYRLDFSVVEEGHTSPSTLVSVSPMLPHDAEWRTLYKTVDPYGFGYLCLLLSEGKEKTLLTIGPFLTECRTQSEKLELFERLGVAPKQQKYAEEYLEGIPVLEEGHPVFLLVDAFCEGIWETNSFAVVDLKSDTVAPTFTQTAPFGKEDAAVEMQTMEKRYAFENELMAAVSKGQLHKENELLAAFSERLFEKRVADPLRNVKNYAIIMNTLLRKAAEAGGVHPFHLDRVSSDFATQIEGLPSPKEGGALMRNMFRGYCRLVRKHATGGLSPVVQKTMLLIDSDLSADLSLDALAKAVGVSGGYLSAAFKREMGKTLTEYVRGKRMDYAKKLLLTTHLQIQTVAAHCGLVDVQYFSKMFKAETGQTPLAFRRAHI